MSAFDQLDRLTTQTCRLVLAVLSPAALAAEHTLSALSRSWCPLHRREKDGTQDLIGLQRRQVFIEYSQSPSRALGGLSLSPGGTFQSGTDTYLDTNCGMTDEQAWHASPSLLPS